MLLQKLAMPFLRSRPPSFCPISPEAYLLTGTSFIYYVMGSDSEGSSWICIATIQDEEDPSFLRMTNINRYSYL
jgi:hypothetical protein